MHSPAAITHRFTPARSHRTRRGNARLKSLAIEQLCQALPNGAVVIDAQCNIIFANREGIDLLTRWGASRVHDQTSPLSGHPKLPKEIITACHQLRQGGAGSSAPCSRPHFGGRLFVRAPKDPNLSAVVALERSIRDRRVAIFCVLLQDRLKDNLIAGRRDRLAMLTVAERRVAKLVAEGLRNDDIATALGKSVTTVKSQLGNIFSKLDIRSRTQLAALLRPVE